MEKAICYFFYGKDGMKILSPDTASKLNLSEDDKVVIWQENDLFLAYNPNGASSEGLFLTYEDLRTLACVCLDDRSFRKGFMK